MSYLNRSDAGAQLATLLTPFSKLPNTLVIALPRGGVVVGYEVAKALSLPLDIVCPRKIGAPFNPELAIGAITETGEGIFNDLLIKEMGVTENFIRESVEKEKKEARARLKRYRGDLPPRNLEDKGVIIVDDGMATGSTMQAAIATVRAEKAKKIIIALPVAPPDALARIEADAIICPLTPSNFYAVGQFYEEFSQTTDEEVIRLIQGSKVL